MMFTILLNPSGHGWWNNALNSVKREIKKIYCEGGAPKAFDDGVTSNTMSENMALLLLEITTAKMTVDNFVTGLSVSLVNNAISPMQFLLGIFTGNYDVGSLDDAANENFEGAYNIGKITGDVIGTVLGAVAAVKGVAQIYSGVAAIKAGIPALSSGVGSGGGAVAIVAGVAGVAIGAIETGTGAIVFISSINNLSNDVKDYNSSKNSWHRMTAKESAAAAKELGFEKTNYRTKNGKPIYYNKKTKTYISQDIGSGDGSGPHNGGVWKQAKTPEGLNSKKTRMGTYDKNLNRIGD